MGKNRRASESSGKGGLKSRSALFTALVGVLTMALVLPLMATHVQPEYIRGSAARTCEQLLGGQNWNELKVTPSSSFDDDWQSDGTLSVHVEYHSRLSFDWNVGNAPGVEAVYSGPGVDAVYVKSGSQGSHLYEYSSPSAGDTHLSVPGTQSISHILFCYTGDPVVIPPVAKEDTVWISRGAESIIIPVADLLENDLNVLADTEIIGSTPGSFGTVEEIKDAGGKIVELKYSPNRPPDAPLFDGYDTFGYTLTGGSTTTVDVFELFDCGETLTLPENEFGIQATYERIPSDPCPEKSYEIDLVTTYEEEDVEEEHPLATVLFKPRVGDLDCSATPTPVECSEVFKATLKFAPRPAANPVDTGQLEYDPFVDDDQDVFRPVPWCNLNPFTVPYSDIADPSGILPAGESWCIASETTVPAGPGETQTTWVLYGIGDPLKRIS